MKKMRKLIPAFAMLLVSAIMMSTASFAWFTMSDTVTATGMQLQAKAAGSLLVSKAPLTSANKDLTVDFESGVEKLTPVTYAADGSDYKDASGAAITNKWIEPADGLKVDPATGKNFVFDEGKTTGTAGAWKQATTTSTSGNYVQEVMYIASAGDAMKAQKLTVELQAPIAPATGMAYKAYSVAIYVFEKGHANWGKANADIDVSALTPAEIVHVDTADGRNVVELKGPNDAGYNIPSVVGIEATNDDPGVGLQIVLRFFVDGDLDVLELADDGSFVAATQETTIYHYVTPTSDQYDEDVVYYVVKTPATADAPAVYDYANTNVMYDPGTGELIDDLTIPAEWLVKEVDEAATAACLRPYNYIRSSDVPTSGTELVLTFKAGDVAPAQQNP